MRSIILVIFCFFISIASYGQDGKGLSLAIGAGYDVANKPIAQFPGTMFNMMTTINRKIENVKTLTIGVGKTLNNHIIVGGDISYHWGVLDWLPEYSLSGTEPIPSINNINWLSTGAWGKYIFFPDSRVHLGIMSSFGMHVGYPKYMGISTIEREVLGYIGVYGGVEYVISKNFKLSYYYGKGKYKNMITIDYLF